MLFPVLRQWLDREPPSGSSLRALPAHLSSNLYGYGAPPLQTTWSGLSADPIANEFSDYVENGLKANGIISALEMIRFSVFAQARFQFQPSIGRSGKLFGNQELAILERPWAGATTGDLLTGMLLDADLGGNAYRIRLGDEIVRLRPDWVEIILAPIEDPYSDGDKYLGYRKVGFLYWHGGKTAATEPSILPADQVCHFAPYPDPNAYGRGMSIWTPVIREVQADKLATEHKARFFENAATPNIHVGLPQMTAENFKKFVDLMDETHKGAVNAYKTLYTANGADVTVLGQNMQQLDYKNVIGAGETRLASAAGVPAVIAGFSEGMQGSSLNAGNYQSAKRRFVDGTMRPLWQNVAGSLETLIPTPSDSQLYYDDRDIPFLREDVQDRANIQQTAAITIRQLIDAGYEPQSVVNAVTNEDMTQLQHSGLFSVQLQEAGTTPPVPEAPRTDVTIAEGAIRSETNVTVPERQTVVNNDVDAHTEPAVVNVDVPERTQDAPVVNVTMPEPRATRKRVETDEIGRITAIVEEEA